MKYGKSSPKALFYALTTICLIAAIAALPATNGVLAASSNSKYKPGHAADVEIVKKVTLKGPAGKGGKTAPTTATGILGTLCEGKKYAIVIGINDYPGTSSDLRYAAADAMEVQRVLTMTYGFLAKDVNLLADTAATGTAIYDTVNTIKAESKPGDEVVFYFSGHGAKGKADDGDTNNMDQAIVVQENGKFAFIWDGELVQWFSGFPTDRIIFIFDSCLAGGMSVLKAPDRVVCMASTINGMSLEGAQWGGGHGQLTYYLVEEGMEYSLADLLLKDGKVTVEEAFDYANANCKSQTPTVADGFVNDLLP